MIVKEVGLQIINTEFESPESLADERLGAVQSFMLPQSIPLTTVKVDSFISVPCIHTHIRITAEITAQNPGKIDDWWA